MNMRFTSFLATIILTIAVRQVFAAQVVDESPQCCPLWVSVDDVEAHRDELDHTLNAVCHRANPSDPDSVVICERTLPTCEFRLRAKASDERWFEEEYEGGGIGGRSAWDETTPHRGSYWSGRPTWDWRSGVRRR